MTRDEEALIAQLIQHLEGARVMIGRLRAHAITPAANPTAMWVEADQLSVAIQKLPSSLWQKYIDFSKPWIGPLPALRPRPGEVPTPRFERLIVHLDSITRLASVWSGGLQIAKNKIVLLGSAPLARLGLRDVNDLDVIVSPDVLDAYARLNPSSVGERKLVFSVDAETGHADDVLMIQMSDHLYSFANEAKISLEDLQYYASAHPSGFKVLALMHCVQIKKLSRRDKDLDDLNLIAEYDRLRGLR